MVTTRGSGLRVSSGWKDRAMSRVGALRGSIARVRPMISDKIATVKPKIEKTMSTVKPKVTQAWQRVSTKGSQLGHNPAVLGGLAGAAGLSLGLLGRYLRHRAHAPMLVVIETY